MNSKITFGLMAITNEHGQNLDVHNASLIFRP
jgi:hypothetical protein